jgi:hypothetical protein
MVRLQLRASVFSQGYQIRALIKIRDFEVQEFASLAPSRGILFSKTTDFERFLLKRNPLQRLRDLRFSKTFLETIFSKSHLLASFENAAC